MRKPTLICDIDSTIWELADTLIPVVEELTGIRHEIHDFDDWDFLRTTHGDELAKQAYVKALDPEHVHMRVLYPYVVEGLSELAEEYRIHFMTHNYHPSRIEPALKEWLRQSFPFPHRLTVTTAAVSKVDRAPNAEVIIDDKPATIAEALDRGLLVATKRHPHNREILVSRPDVVRFDDWREAPELVRRAAIERDIHGALARSG